MSNLANNSTQPDWSELPDPDLIQACLDGQEEAWTALVERYSRLIYTIPLRFGMHKQVADEIFQETCLIMLEKLDTLQDRERLSSWIITVARRACIQRWRRNDRVQLVEIHETHSVSHTDLDVGMVQIEQQHIIERAMARLNPRCQELLTALFFDHPPKTYEEITEQMNIALGSIGPTRSRCLKKLREEILDIEASFGAVDADSERTR